MVCVYVRYVCIVCVCECVYDMAQCICGTQNNLEELVPCFHSVEPDTQSQFVKFGIKHNTQ